MIKREYTDKNVKKVIYTKTLTDVSSNVEGKKVILAKLHEDWNYGNSNPTWGKNNKFIKGTIREFRKDNSLKINVRWDNGETNNYSPKYLDEIIKEGENKPMLEKAKELANSGYDAVKPYEKYMGLIALAVVIDHFFMGNKYTDKFKSLADKAMKKMINTVEKAVDAICGDDDESSENPTKEAKTEEVKTDD